MSHRSTAVVLGAAVLALSTAGTTAVAANGRLPLIDRTASGKVDQYGGAARSVATRAR